MNRSGICFVCFIVAASLFAGMMVARADSPSWTQYQGDAAHSGHVPVTVTASAIQPLWTVTAQALAQSMFAPGAVTDAAHVYITGLGTAQDQVLALDSGTGSKTWSTSFVPYSGSLSEPSIGNGMVYVHQWGHSGISGGNPSQYPYVSGMNATTGNLVFATSHSGQWDSGSRPTVAGNQVFAAGGYYGGLDAYDATSGARQWFAEVNQQYGWIPAANDGLVCVYMGSASASPGPQNGTFYAFDRRTGASAFKIVNLDDQFTMFDGTVSIGDQNDAITLTHGSKGQTLVSFDLAQHSVRWRSAANYSGALAIDNGSIFANNGIELDVLNESTGQKTGSWFAPAGHYLKGNLLVTNNLIFAQTDVSTYAIDRNTLAPVWSTDRIGDLALGDGLLLISSSTSLSAYSVPEPSSLVLLGTVISGLLFCILAKKRPHKRAA